MITVSYQVKQIAGDYAILVDTDGDENKVAMALLPLEIEEGDSILCENFEYRIVK